jgi:poly(3-hydroxybutyrate) depolymerase
VKIAEIPLVDMLLDAVEADYCVDTARVYASGVSNGGDMVNYVACRDAGRFAAVAPGHRGTTSRCRRWPTGWMAGLTSMGAHRRPRR